MLSLPDLTPAIWLSVKILIVITLGVDLVFSVVFWHKVRLLSKIVETPVSPLIVSLALVSVISTFVFLAAAVIFI